MDSGKSCQVAVSAPGHIASHASQTLVTNTWTWWQGALCQLLKAQVPPIPLVHVEDEIPVDNAVFWSLLVIIS